MKMNLRTQISYRNDLPIDAQDLFLNEMVLEGLEGKAEREARKKEAKSKES